jgi:hypothetical protein
VCYLQSKHAVWVAGDSDENAPACRWLCTAVARKTLPTSLPAQSPLLHLVGVAKCTSCRPPHSPQYPPALEYAHPRTPNPTFLLLMHLHY